MKNLTITFLLCICCLNVFGQPASHKTTTKELKKVSGTNDPAKPQKLSSKQEKSNVEIKLSSSPNDNSSTEQTTATGNDKVTLPITTNEQTDPNYEINLKKSQEVANALSVMPTPPPTKEQRILTLEYKIANIKQGIITDPMENEKLAAYEAELYTLKNTTEK